MRACKNVCMYVCAPVRIYPQVQVSRGFPSTGSGPPEFQKTLPQVHVSRGFPSTGSANSFPTGGPCTRVQMGARMYVGMYVCTYVYVCLPVCMYVCMFCSVCSSVCMYV